MGAPEPCRGRSRGGRGFGLRRCDGFDSFRVSPTRSESRGALAPSPVLVVDDNPINLRVACGMLRLEGYEVRTATNGAEALEAVQREPFALVFMDCHMPTMDGLEATRRIRALSPPVNAIPIVALTAAALPEELEVLASTRAWTTR